MNQAADLMEGLGEAFASVLTELTSIWTLIQIGIIVIAAVAAHVVRRLVRTRINTPSLTAGWPNPLRVLLKLLAENSGAIAFLIIAATAHAAIVASTFPSRGYFLGVASSLVTAWIVIAVLAGLIRNHFVNRLVAISAWSIAALSILGLLQPLAAALDSVALTLGGVRISPLLVLKLTAFLMLALWAASIVSDFVERRIRESADLTPSIQVLIGKLARLALITFAVLVVVSSVGIDLTALAFFSGAVGVGVGFGLQKIVSNLVSGIILLADKSIKPGDVISVGENFGWVDAMGARCTSVVTRDGREFLIPNEDFVTQQVVNWSYSNEEIRLEVKFGVAYTSDPHEVVKHATGVARAHPRVLEEPPPVCFLLEFGDSSLNFTLRFWIRDPTDGITNVRGAVMLALWDAFKREGIEIPYPVRDVRITQAAAPKAPAAKRRPPAK